MSITSSARAQCDVCGVHFTQQEPSIASWSDRQYCRACVDEAGWFDHSGPLELAECVELPTGKAVWSGLKYGVRSALLLGAALGAAGASIGIGMNLVPIEGMSETKASPRQMLLGIPIFIAFAVCFVGVVALPTGLVQGLRGRKRKVEARDGKVFATVGSSKFEAPTEQIVWSMRSGASDSYGMHDRHSQQVKLEFDNDSDCCGFDDDVRAKWVGLLRLTGAHKNRDSHLALIVVRYVPPAIVGAVLGSLSASVWALSYHLPFYLVAGGLIGLIQGLLYAHSANRIRKGDPRALEHVRTGSIVFTDGMIGVLVALKLSVGVWQARLSFAIFSGIVGAAKAVWLRRTANSLEANSHRS